MTREELKKVVLDAAVALARKGPGWGQESVVLREVAKQVRPQLGAGLQVEQAILTAWHELFFEKKLSWGYSLDNPNSPFYHVPEGDAPLTNLPPLSTAETA
jgi:hypothetical protein